MMPMGWRTATWGLSLIAFAALALWQLGGLLIRVLQQPIGAERRALAEELLWVLTAVATVLALTVYAIRGPSGG